MAEQQPCVGKVERVALERLRRVSVDELCPDSRLFRGVPRDCQRFLVVVDAHDPTRRTDGPGKLQGHLPIPAADVHAAPAGAHTDSGEKRTGRFGHHV